MNLVDVETSLSMGGAEKVLAPVPRWNPLATPFGEAFKQWPKPDDAFENEYAMNYGDLQRFVEAVSRR